MEVLLKMPSEEKQLQLDKAVKDTEKIIELINSMRGNPEDCKIDAGVCENE